MTGWLEGAGAYRLGWTLIHSLWQGALIAGAFFVARMALRRSSAQTRYLAACGALVLLAAAPVLTFLTGPEALFPLFLHLGKAASPAGGALALAGQGAGAVLASGSSGAAAWAWSVAALLDKNLPWLVAAWLLGLMVFLTRWVQGCWWVRRVKQQQVAEMGAEWLGRLNDLKCRLAVSRPVRLLESALVDVPMVVGWLRPVILLPASALSGLTPAQLEAILAHELAHVRRHDYLVNSVQHLVEAFLFYHPAAWWLSRCIRQEREHCCDDLVVSLCGDRLGYARALMRLEELRGGFHQWAVAAGGGSLLQRIRRVLGVTPNQQPAGAREFSGLALIGLGCLCLFAGVGLMFSPKDYQASCRIKVEHEQAANVFSDPWFPQTEFEVIQSQLVLNRVSDSLQLRRKWAARGDRAELSRAEALVRLKSRLNLRVIRNTSLVEVQVRDEDANEAADIANAVADAYRQYRAEAQWGREQAGLRALEQQRDGAEQNVNEAQKQVNELRAKLNIPADVGDANGLPQPLSAETLRRLQALRVETQTEFIRQRTLLEKLKALAPERDQLAEALPSSGIGDALLSSLLEQRTLAEQRLVSLQNEFGPQHVEVLKAASQVEELRAKLQERENGILVGLEVKVASLKEGLANLQAEVEHAMQAQADFARQAQPYLTARSHLEGLQRIRDALDMRIATEKTEQALHRDRLVELIDRAVAPARPVSPNGRFAGALLGSGLVLVLLGIVLARSGSRQLGVPALA